MSDQFLGKYTFNSDGTITYEKDPFKGIKIGPQPTIGSKLKDLALTLLGKGSDFTGMASPGPLFLKTPVFHGTNQVFDKFLNNKLAKDTLYGIGHYFTDSPKVASGYALNKISYMPQVLSEDVNTYEANLMALKDKTIELIKNPKKDSFKVIRYNPEPSYPNVHKVFLDIENPFDVSTDTLNNDQLNKLNIKSSSGNLDYIKSKFKGIEQDFPEMLKSLGYDSLVYPGGKMYSGVEPHRVFVVNDPSKIISAFNDIILKKFKNAKKIIQ